MKRLVLNKLGVLVVVGLILWAVLVAGIKINQKMSTTQYVEPYCSIKYRFDVAEYKQCKDLKPNDLIERISSEIYIEVEKQQGVKVDTDYNGGIQ